MKFVIDNWYLILVALASGAMLLWPLLKSASGGSLTPVRAVQLINREKAVVIDVCETEEFAAGHVGGAKNVPLGNAGAGLGAKAAEHPRREGIAPGLGRRGDLPIDRVHGAAEPLVAVIAAVAHLHVVHDGARANRAVAMAKKLGYDNAQSMAGGLKAWREASLPVEKA